MRIIFPFLAVVVVVAAVGAFVFSLSRKVPESIIPAIPILTAKSKTLAINVGIILYVSTKISNRIRLNWILIFADIHQ